MAVFFRPFDEKSINSQDTHGKFLNSLCINLRPKFSKLIGPFLKTMPIGLPFRLPNIYLKKVYHNFQNFDTTN